MPHAYWKAYYTSVDLCVIILFLQLGPVWLSYLQSWGLLVIWCHRHDTFCKNDLAHCTSIMRVAAVILIHCFIFLNKYVIIGKYIHLFSHRVCENIFAVNGLFPEFSITPQKSFARCVNPVQIFLTNCILCSPA